MKSLEQIALLRTIMGPNHPMIATMENIVSLNGFITVIKTLDEYDVSREAQIKAATTIYVQLVASHKDVSRLFKGKPFTEEQDQQLDALQRQIVELVSDFISDALETK